MTHSCTALFLMQYAICAGILFFFLSYLCSYAHFLKWMWIIDVNHFSWCFFSEMMKENTSSSQEQMPSRNIYWRTVTSICVNLLFVSSYERTHTILVGGTWNSIYSFRSTFCYFLVYDVNSQLNHYVELKQAQDCYHSLNNLLYHYFDSFSSLCGFIIYFTY